MNQSYNNYGASLKLILQEFILFLKHTFGAVVEYVGTTTNLETPSSKVRDIDIIIILSQVNVTNVDYIWKIINRLHTKYSIFLDAGIYSTDQLQSIPVVNKYLLRNFLNDQLGTNPFHEFAPDSELLRNECLERIREQEKTIISIMPRIASDHTQIKTVAQGVYDAIRAYLILEENEVASKDEACARFTELYPKYAEAKAIYEGYLDPSSVVDVSSYILDSLAIVKHLLYKAENKPFENEILLINTPSSLMGHPKDDYLSYDHNMPLGLVCLASYLEKAKHSVRILDAYAENLGPLSAVDRIFQEKALPKIIGLNSASPNIHIVHRIAHYIKRIREDVILVCGGPHASLATKHTFSTGDIDYCIVGEGEQPLLNLVNALLNVPSKKGLPRPRKNQNIPGVYYNQSGRSVGIPNKEMMDLSKIPLPNFNFLPISRYFQAKKRLYIHTSRGCGFNCIYCSVPTCWGKQVREIPVDTILNHLTILLDQYQPKEIQIVDDNFSHRNGKLIRAFCEGILRKSINVRWKCQVRADQLDQDLVGMMAESGCFEVDMGVETGNQQIQRYIRKGLDLAKTLSIVEAIHANKIIAKAFFMLGFPEETFEQLSDTINYSIQLKNNGLDDVAFFPVMPFPGTEIAKKTGKEVFQGAIIDDFDVYERSFAANRLRKYSAKPEVSLNSNFNPEELRLLVKFAYQRFNYQASVRDLRIEFSEYVTTQENNYYGL